MKWGIVFFVILCMLIVSSIESSNLYIDKTTRQPNKLNASIKSIMKERIKNVGVNQTHISISQANLDQIDQQNTEGSFGRGIETTEDYIAQTFTPSLGRTTRVSLLLRVPNGCDKGDIVVELRRGYPPENRRVITKSSIPLKFIIPEELYWVDFDYPDRTLNVGDVYSIVIHITENNTTPLFIWCSDDHYPNGSLWLGCKSGEETDWYYESENEDICFKVYGYPHESNQPPYKPSNPFPANGSTSADCINTTLMWDGGDPDTDDTVAYLIMSDIPYPLGWFLESGSTRRISIALPIDLKANTTYHWQIFAIDDHGNAIVGPMWHFKTKSKPSVETEKASNIESTSAKLNGKILYDGGESCQIGFKWRRYGEEEWKFTGWEGSKNTGESFSRTLSGLTPSTRYEFKAGAKNSAGESWGDIKSFTTTEYSLPSWIQELLNLTGVTGSWDGDHFHAEIPISRDSIKGLPMIDGSIPKYVNLKKFGGNYELNINYNAIIEVDIYIDDPGESKVRLKSGDCDLSMHTYADLPAGGEANFDVGLKGNFEKKNGNDFGWNLSVYLNGNLTFPSLTIQGSIWIIPVYIKANLNCNAGVEFFFGSPTEWRKGQTISNVFKHVDGYIGIGAIVYEGAGLADIIGVGLYQDVGGRWNFKAPERNGNLFNSFYAHFIFGAYGELFCLGEGKWEWFKTSWSYGQTNIKPLPTGKFNWTFIPREKYERSNKWQDGTGDVLINDVFSAAHPSIDGNNKGKMMMTWVEYKKPNLKHGDGLEIMYSIWDGKRWSEPKQLTNDERGESNPCVALLDNGHAICLFSYLPKSIGKSVGEMFSQAEIAYSIWDGKSWSKPKLLIDGGTPEHMDMFPKVADDGDKAAVVWLCDNDTNVFTVNNRTLQAAIWNGEKWNFVGKIETSVVSASISLTYKNGKAICFYIIDEDGKVEGDNPSVRKDQHAYVRIFDEIGWKSPQRIDSGNNRVAIPSTTYIGDEEAFSWAEEQHTDDGKIITKIRYKEGTDGKISNVATIEGHASSISLFCQRFTTPGGGTGYYPVIVWNDGKNLWFKRKISDKWEEPQNLYSSQRQITQVDWYYSGGKEIAAVFIEKDNITSYKNCKLMFRNENDLNVAPEKPIIEGPSTAVVGVPYPYSVTTNDLNNDKVYLRFRWKWEGEQTYTESSFDHGPYNSGEKIDFSITFDKPGKYTRWVQAKDEKGLVSEWSDGLTINIRENRPPDKPEKPIGPTNGKIRTTYGYSTYTIELDGEKIYYLFDWGDGTNSGWKGPYNSSEKVTVYHSWSKRGSYQIRVKAKDEYGLESNWSDPLPVTMPKSCCIKDIIKWYVYQTNPEKRLMYKLLTLLKRHLC